MHYPVSEALHGIILRHRIAREDGYGLRCIYAAHNFGPLSCAIKVNQYSTGGANAVVPVSAKLRHELNGGFIKTGTKLMT